VLVLVEVEDVEEDKEVVAELLKTCPKLRRKSHLLLEDAQVNLMTVNALQLSHELADLIREGYFQDSFYGNGGEWTKDSRIEAIDGYFWRLDRLCIPRNSELRLRLIT
jgi:hypothetical protein